MYSIYHLSCEWSIWLLTAHRIQSVKNVVVCMSLLESTDLNDYPGGDELSWTPTQSVVGIGLKSSKIFGWAVSSSFVFAFERCVLLQFPNPLSWHSFGCYHGRHSYIDSPLHAMHVFATISFFGTTCCIRSWAWLVLLLFSHRNEHTIVITVWLTYYSWTDNNMNNDKLSKLQNQVRIGGKGKLNHPSI